MRQLSESGREIVLCRVNAGGSRVLTTAGTIVEEAYTAEGIAETEGTAVAVARAVFDEAFGASAGFRRFVSRGQARRIAALFLTIDDIALRRVDLGRAVANGPTVLAGPTRLCDLVTVDIFE